MSNPIQQKASAYTKIGNSIDQRETLALLAIDLFRRAEAIGVDLLEDVRCVVEGGVPVPAGATLWEAGNPEPAPESAPQPPRLRAGLLVPAYFDPASKLGGEAWEKLEAAAERVPVLVVVKDQLMTGRAGKVKILGRVNLGFGSRSTTAVDAEIEEMLAFSKKTDILDGTFFDNCGVSTEADFRNRELVNRTRQDMRGPFVFNPGHPRFKRSLTDIADIVVLHAGPNFQERSGYPTFLRQYPPERFAVLVSHVEKQEMALAIARRVIEAGVGWVYVTGEPSRNAWDGLPSYFDALVDEISGLSQGRP